MSRKQRQQAVTRKLPAHEQFVLWLLGLPRIGRIGVAALFALVVTLAVSPIIDTIYLRYLYTPESVLAPALVSTGFGLAMYFVGWQLIIGTVGEIPPARMVVLWYVGVGVLAFVLVVVWLITGFASGNAPTA